SGTPGKNGIRMPLPARPFTTRATDMKGMLLTTHGCGRTMSIISHFITNCIVIGLRSPAKRYRHQPGNPQVREHRNRANGKVFAHGIGNESRYSELSLSASQSQHQPHEQSRIDSPAVCSSIE